MATGTINANPNIIYDSVSFNLNTFSSATGYAEVTFNSGKTHKNYHIVGYGISCDGINDIKAYNISPVLVNSTGSGVFVVYNRTGTGTIDRAVTIYLMLSL